MEFLIWLGKVLLGCIGAFIVAFLIVAIPFWIHEKWGLHW
jgi:hypothetical protein